jgi:hypothetical protein
MPRISAPRMAQDLRIDRRRLLVGAGATLALLAVSSRVTAGTDERGLPLDVEDPRVALEAYLRAAFAAPGGSVAWWYYGELYGYLPDGGLRPLVRSATVLTARVESAAPGHARIHCEEVGYSRDFDTGAAIDAFEHPFTGAKMALPAFHDAPYARDHVAVADALLCQKMAHGTTEPEPFRLEWSRAGGDLTIRQSSPVVKPHERGWLPYSRLLDFHADAEAFDSGAPFVPCEQDYLVVLGQPPFVGTAPGDGLVVLRGYAVKAPLGNVLDGEVLARIEAAAPAFAARVASTGGAAR